MGAVGEQQAAMDSEARGVPLPPLDDDDCDFDLHGSEANGDDLPSPRETVQSSKRVTEEDRTEERDPQQAEVTMIC